MSLSPKGMQILLDNLPKSMPVIDQYAANNPNAWEHLDPEDPRFLAAMEALKAEERDRQTEISFARNGY